MLSTLRLWTNAGLAISDGDVSRILEYGQSIHPSFKDLVRSQDDSQLDESGKRALVSWTTRSLADGTLGPQAFDPFVLATTKACPTCSMRSTHFHGHACHMISPYDGCPNCHVNYCYRCLATEFENEAERGDTGECECGCWHSYCDEIAKEQDVADFIRLKDNFMPYDVRCGCVICNVCARDKSCEECDGTCAVCRGFVHPAPTAIGEKWQGIVVLTRQDAREAKLKVTRTNTHERKYIITDLRTNNINIRTHAHLHSYTNSLTHTNTYTHSHIQLHAHSP